MKNGERWGLLFLIVEFYNFFLYLNEYLINRKDLQGLEPPIKRSEADFDPGAKYHIPAYVPYAR